MITDCFGARQWDLSDTEAIFTQGVFVLVKILIPVAIWVYTWKVCRSDRAHHRTSLLGLEETQGLTEMPRIAEAKPSLKTLPHECRFIRRL
jgi:hypothetical protein